MKILFLFVVSCIALSSCVQSLPDSINNDLSAYTFNADSTIVPKKDILTKAEKAFFLKLKEREELAITDSVMRYYELKGGYVKNTKSEFIYPTDDSIDDHYISYFLTFAATDKDMSAVHIEYEFSAGTSSQGNGTIFIINDQIIHANSSCGYSCSVDVWMNGEVFLQEISDNEVMMD